MRQFVSNDVFWAGLFGLIEGMNQRPATQVGKSVIDVGQAKYPARNIGPVDVTLYGTPGNLITGDEEGPLRRVRELCNTVWRTDPSSRQTWGWTRLSECGMGSS
jgi:hypothetical protein